MNVKQNKSTKQKVGSLKTLVKLINCQKDHARKKIEKTEITNVKNETGDITADPNDIKKKIRRYYKQFYANTLKNSEKRPILQKHNTVDRRNENI